VQTHHVAGWTWNRIAAKVVEIKAHILISLDCGHNGKVPDLPALRVAGLRPAPVQGCHIGLQGTTGAEFMQYRHTDLVATPPDLGQPAVWSERLVVLPHSNLICNHRKLHPRLRSLRAVRPNPNLAGLVAYAYFSQLYKASESPLPSGPKRNSYGR
jgi:predicted O-linked N-acetylglucosamine transferase (SPINDLY family)